MAEVQIPGLLIDGARLERVPGLIALINRDPCPEEVGVPRGTAIYLEVVDVASEDAPIGQVFVNDVMAWTGAVVRPEFQGAGFSATEGVGVLRLRFVPTTNFDSEEQVTVRVVMAGTGGHNIDESYTFTIEDVTAPSLVAAQARAQQVVRLSFSEPVLAPDGATFTFERLGAPGVGLEAVAFTASGSYVDVTVHQEMTPDIAYRVTAAGVTDLVGNVLGDNDSAEFTGFRPPRPDGRDFDLWSMLPMMNRREDVSGELRAVMACFQDVTDLLLALVDRFSDLWDIDRAPDEALDLLLSDLGNPFTTFTATMTALQKRRLASVLMEMYRQKGTAAGIENAILVFMGLDATVRAMRRTGLILGVSELGNDWELGSDDRRVLYSFTVEVPVVLTDDERAQVRALAEFLKPAHTHLDHIIEPVPPDAIDHWALGLSALGDTTILH